MKRHNTFYRPRKSRCFNQKKVGGSTTCLRTDKNMSDCIAASAEMWSFRILCMHVKGQGPNTVRDTHWKQASLLFVAAERSVKSKFTKRQKRKTKWVS